MAVTITAVKRLFTDTCSITDQGITENRQYLVTVTEAAATPYEVAAAVHASIPAAFSAHETNPLLLVQKKSAKRAKEYTANNWIIDVEFSPKKPGQGNDSENSDSDAKNITISITGQEETIYTQKTVNDDGTPGVQVLNAAGDVYPEPIEVQIYDDVIVIDYYTGDPPDTDLRGKVNSDAVTLTIPQSDLGTFTKTWAAGTLRMKGIDIRVEIPPTNITGEQAWHVTITMEYRADGWKKKLVQKGHRYMKDGVKVDSKTGVVNLAADGTKLAEGATLVVTDPGKQFYATGAFVPFLQAVNNA